MAGEDVAAAVESMEMPAPGQYSSSAELLELSLPGASEEVLDFLSSAFAEGAGETSTYCVSAEDAANSREEMLQGMMESECTVTRFDVSGETIDGAMSCPAGEGITGEATMTGTMGADGADMIITFNTEVPGMGEATIGMRVTSERVGDCPS